MAFATVTDIEARWRNLSTDEKDRATVLLDDAEALIRAEFANAHKEIDEEGQVQALKAVSCAIVKRAMTAPDGDYTQYQTSAGSFSEQYSYNSDGAIYIKKGEKSMLGLLKTGKIQNVSLTGGVSCQN
ncbi:MAG: Gp19/Gp15/Gp42 family protein [Coriobacteriia bacterium]|nr:Gp19/Gp15/Gp42 family protein [Coriobacteriia bacterium]